MIWHPFSLAILFLYLAALFFLSRAVLTAARVVVHWSPASAKKEQLRLETAAETAALSARAALVLTGLAAIVMVLAVTNVFPALVPGAMCGTGVLQAAAGRGEKAFFFTLSALAALYAWAMLERLNRQQPDFPLIKSTSRMLMLSLPLLALAAGSGMDFLGHLNTHSAVDCCSVVYDQFTTAESAMRTGGISDAGLVRLFAILTFMLAAAGGWGLLHNENSGGSAAAAAVLSILWAPVAALALVRVFSASIYEVLHHHCPWCLFLPEHHFVGFPFFTLLFAASVHGPIALMICRACARRPGLSPAGRRHTRRALAVMVISTLLFAAASAFPALSWRLRFGVWMG